MYVVVCHVVSKSGCRHFGCFTFAGLTLKTDLHFNKSTHVIERYFDPVSRQVNTKPKLSRRMALCFQFHFLLLLLIISDIYSKICLERREIKPNNLLDVKKNAQ